LRNRLVTQSGRCVLGKIDGVAEDGTFTKNLANSETDAVVGGWERSQKRVLGEVEAWLDDNYSPSARVTLFPKAMMSFSKIWVRVIFLPLT